MEGVEKNLTRKNILTKVFNVHNYHVLLAELGIKHTHTVTIIFTL